MENESVSESSSGEFNLREAAEEIISSDGEPSSNSTQATQAEGQLATDPNKTVSDEQRASDILNGKVVEEKPAEVNQALLDQINSIGAMHNGLPIKVDSPDQVKELLQKGLDYTKKTMAHAKMDRLKQEEYSKKEASYVERDAQYAQKEQGMQDVSLRDSLVNSMVAKWEKSDPELFAYVQDAYKAEFGEYNKNQPIIAQYENRFKQFEDKFAQIEQGKNQSALEGIKQGWESGLADIQTQRGAKLKELGIVPNWEKVKEIWTSDASGKMTHEQALLAAHGSDMIKMAESKVKNLQSKNSVYSKNLSRGGTGGSQKEGKTITAQVAGDYMSILRQAEQQF